MNKVLLLLVLTSFLLGNFLTGNYGNNRLDVYYLSIGQGDSILIKTPDQKLILVDGGVDSTVLVKLGQVLPVWVREIDFLLLSHPDLDHLGGLNDVVERYSIGTVLLGYGESSSLAYANFKQVIDQLNINVSRIDANSDFVLGCCTKMDFLWPQKFDKGLSVNNNSVAFILKYGSFSAYFGGDLEYRYEEQATKNLFLDVDVMKASHHGSRTSTSQELIDNIQPEVVIISAGFENKFNHPHPEVLEVLENNDVQIYRTDLDGTIKLTTDGESYELFKSQ